MALDGQVATLLSVLEEQGMKDFADMTVQEARAAAAAFIDLQGIPEPIAHCRDAIVEGPGGEIPVRLYYPSDHDAPRPAVVYFHGGGWVIGNLEIADKPCRTLANATGVAVVSVGYRKAPEAPYPAAPEDCYAATRWVISHAAELGIDPDRVGVAGDSAGGNLAAVTSLMARDRGDPRISFQLLLYPAVDAIGEYPSKSENGDGYLLTHRSMTWFYENYLENDGQVAGTPYVSPSRAELTDLPPTVIVTAGFDPLRDEGTRFAEALVRAGVATEHRHYPTMIHAFFWMLGIVDQTRIAFDEVGALVKKLVRS